MIQFANLTQLFNFGLKGLFLISAILYFVFSLIIVRQVIQMNTIIHDKFNNTLKIIALVHALLALILLFLTFGI